MHPALCKRVYMYHITSQKKENEIISDFYIIFLKKNWSK